MIADRIPREIATQQPVVQGKPVGCRDECGAKELEPLHKGWQFLVITNQWRCPACWRALDAMRAA